MGRDNNHDPTMVHHSSIALLQERFRQLQRVKEMREERDLRKMFNEPNKQLFSSSSNNPISSSSSSEPTTTKLSSRHELISSSTPSSTRSPPPPQPPHHVSLSLWPTSSQVNIHKEDQRSFQKQVVSVDLWKNVYDWDSAGSDSGVDTSLHL